MYRVLFCSSKGQRAPLKASSGLQLQQQRDKSERVKLVGRADRDIERLRAKEFSPSKAASSGTGDGALEYGNFV